MVLCRNLLTSSGFDSSSSSHSCKRDVWTVEHGYHIERDEFLLCILRWERAGDPNICTSVHVRMNQRPQHHIISGTLTTSDEYRTPSGEGSKEQLNVTMRSHASGRPSLYLSKLNMKRTRFSLCPSHYKICQPQKSVKVGAGVDAMMVVLVVLVGKLALLGVLEEMQLVL